MSRKDKQALYEFLQYIVDIMERENLITIGEMKYLRDLANRFYPMTVRERIYAFFKSLLKGGKNENLPKRSRKIGKASR